MKRHVTLEGGYTRLAILCMHIYMYTHGPQRNVALDLWVYLHVCTETLQWAHCNYIRV